MVPAKLTLLQCCVGLLTAYVHNFIRKSMTQFPPPPHTHIHIHTHLSRSYAATQFSIHADVRNSDVTLHNMKVLGTILRFHGADHSPWLFDNVTQAVIRQYLEMRYALAPSLVAAGRVTQRQGTFF